MESFDFVDQWITHSHPRLERERRELIARYRGDVEAFVAIASPHVQSLTERNTDAWKPLETMPLERLRAHVESFHAYRDVCEKEARQDGDISETQLAWRMMRRLGLTPPSNLMGMIQETDVVEIYDLSLNQIFRNFNFFRVSSYTFEDLMHHPLSELFDRPPELQDIMFGEIGAVFSGRAREAFYSALPVHRAEERFSQKRYHARVEQRVMSPLFNETGHVLAILASINIKITGLSETELKPPVAAPGTPQTKLFLV